jgi:hypothetical protein
MYYVNGSDVLQTKLGKEGGPNMQTKNCPAKGYWENYDLNKSKLLSLSVTVIRKII